MSISNMTVHDVVSIKLERVNSLERVSWRYIKIETAEGHTFTLALFADDADNLKINLQEAGD